MSMQSSLWTPRDGLPPSPRESMRLFALQATAELGKAIADRLGQSLSLHEEREFEDGEHKARPLDPVIGKDVYVIQSLHGGPSMSANDKLCRLLFFIGALKDAGAARVTAVVPYLCYARKDRRTKPNDPVTTRYVAGMFEAVGTDVVVTLEVHNPTAFENAFRCRTVTLTGTPLFVAYAKPLEDDNLCVVSPDTGGAKRAELFENRHAVLLNNLDAILQTDEGLRVSFAGDRGLLNTQSRDFEIRKDDGDLDVSMNNGYSVQARSLAWKDRTREIVSEQPVRIFGQGFRIQGDQLTIRLENQEFSVVGDVHVTQDP